MKKRANLGVVLVGLGVVLLILVLIALTIVIGNQKLQLDDLSKSATPAMATFDQAGTQVAPLTQSAEETFQANPTVKSIAATLTAETLAETQTRTPTP